MINEFLRYAYNSQGCKVSEMTQRKRPSLIKTGFLAVTSKPLLLIPDPMDSKFSYALELVNWIWDQSLLTVEINTITRWAVKELPNVT